MLDSLVGVELSRGLNKSAQNRGVVPSWAGEGLCFLCGYQLAAHAFHAEKSEAEQHGGRSAIRDCDRVDRLIEARRAGSRVNNGNDVRQRIVGRTQDRAHRACGKGRPRESSNATYLIGALKGSRFEGRINAGLSPADFSNKLQVGRIEARFGKCDYQRACASGISNN